MIIAISASALTLLAAADHGHGATNTSRLNEDPPKVVINYADLNLRSADDANLMLGRIRKASVQVCRASRQMSGTYLHDDCYTGTLRRAVKKLNAPKVTAAYEARLYRFRLPRFDLAGLQ